MNYIVTYRTRDNVMDFLKVINSNQSAALIMVSQLENCLEVDVASELNNFYLQTDAKKPQRVVCTGFDKSGEWASVRLNARTHWLWLPPFKRRGWYSARRESAITRMLNTQDGWALACMNFKTLKARKTFCEQRAAIYLAEADAIDLKITNLIKKQEELRAKAAGIKAPK